MSVKAETTFKNRIRKHLDKLPRTYVRKIQQRSIRGVPDFLLCVNGLFVALELKVPKHEDDERADPLQEWNIDCVRQAGGMALVVTPKNWPNVLEELQDLACKPGLVDGSVKPEPH